MGEPGPAPHQLVPSPRRVAVRRVDHPDAQLRRPAGLGYRIPVKSQDSNIISTLDSYIFSKEQDRRAIRPHPLILRVRTPRAESSQVQGASVCQHLESKGGSILFLLVKVLSVCSSRYLAHSQSSSSIRKQTQIDK